MGPNLELPRTQVKPTLIALIQNPAPPLSQILTVPTHFFGFTAIDNDNS